MLLALISASTIARHHKQKQNTEVVNEKNRDEYHDPHLGASNKYQRKEIKLEHHLHLSPHSQYNQHLIVNGETLLTNRENDTNKKTVPPKRGKRSALKAAPSESTVAESFPEQYPRLNAYTPPEEFTDMDFETTV